MARSAASSSPTRYGKALPIGYIEASSTELAAADVETCAALKSADDLRLSLYRAPGDAASLRLKLFRFGAPIALSEALPMMENMGLRVLSEHPFEMALGAERASSSRISRCSAQAGIAGRSGSGARRFQEAFERIWRGEVENDGFNRLILSAQMDWRQVAMLRGYCKYLLQTGVPFSQAYMEEALNRYPQIARAARRTVRSRASIRRAS